MPRPSCLPSRSSTIAFAGGIKKPSTNFLSQSNRIQIRKSAEAAGPGVLGPPPCTFGPLEPPVFCVNFPLPHPAPFILPAFSAPAPLPPPLLFHIAGLRQAEAGGVALKIGKLSALLLPSNRQSAQLVLYYKWLAHEPVEPARQANPHMDT